LFLNFLLLGVVESKFDYDEGLNTSQDTVATTSFHDDAEVCRPL